MRKFLVSVILVMMLCVSAYADIVYTTDTGNMGLIGITGSTSADFYGTQCTGIDSSLLLGSYWDGSSTRIILVDRTTDLTTSGDTALIFSPSNLTAPINENITLSGVYNTQAISGSNNGRGLFLASGASVYELRTLDFQPVRSYTYDPETSRDITPKVKALLMGTYMIYAMIEQENSADIILGFDGQLRDDVENFTKEYLPSGTTSISWLSRSRIAAAHTDGVSIWGSSGFISIVSTDAPVKALCQDSENGFYFLERAQSGDTYMTTLKHYSSGEITILSTGDTGLSCQLIRDETYNVLGAVTGSRILLYNMKDDLLIGEYDASSLGGLPVYITAGNVKGDDSSSSSGCDVSGMGMIVLMSVLIILKAVH